MNRISAIVVLVVAFASFPAVAASSATCERFTKAFARAGETLGTPVDSDTLAFFKKQCAKKPEAEVTRDADCLERVRKEDDMKKCMSK